MFTTRLQQGITVLIETYLIVIQFYTFQSLGDTPGTEFT